MSAASAPGGKLDLKKASAYVEEHGTQAAAQHFGLTVDALRHKLIRARLWKAPERRSVWTPSLLRIAKKCLGRHEDVTSALDEVSKATGIKHVTVVSLEHAFRRAGDGTPHAYLAAPKNRIDLTPKDALERKLEARAAKSEKHRQGLTEVMLEKMTLAVESVKPCTIEVTRELPPRQRPSGPPEIIWIEISDVQLGTCVESDKMGGINYHDWKTFLAKLDAWKETVKTTIRERRAERPIESVIVTFLGDIVEGHNIFKGQTYELDADIYKQAFKGAEDFAVAVAEIASTFPDLKFTVYGVGGNHGRVGAYGEAPYRCNWDLVLYEFMRLRWLAIKGLDNLSAHFPSAWFQLVDTWGWKHLLVHLDDVKGSLGLPFYGLQRYLGKNIQMIQRMINYLHGGHFHAETSLSLSVGDVLVNGNWIGANSYSKTIVEANTPVQLIYGFTEANGLEWSRKVYLRSRKEMKPDLTIYQHGGKKNAR